MTEYYMLGGGAREQLRSRLPNRRFEQPVGNTGHAALLNEYATQTVSYGQPVADHTYLATEDYNTVDGGTIEAVLNDTGVTLLSAAWYFLWQVDGKWYAKPAQYDQCNPENPVV